MAEDKRAGNHTVRSGLCEWLDRVATDPTVDEDRDVDAALSQFGFQRRHAPWHSGRRIDTFDPEQRAHEE